MDDKTSVSYVICAEIDEAVLSYDVELIRKSTL